MSKYRRLAREMEDMQRINSKLEEGLRMQKEHIGNHEKILASALEELSQSLCLPICKVLMETLPVELRNMVYFHLCTPKNVDMAFLNRGHSEYCNFTDSNPHPPLPFQDQYCKPPHWWRADFVGQQFLDELVREWYHTSTFNVNMFDLDNLLRLLDENPWIENQPPKDLINNIRLAIRIDSASEWRTEAALAAYQTSLQEVLNTLNALEKPVRVSVDLTNIFRGRMQAVEKVRMDFEVRALASFLPLLRRLKRPVQVLIDGVVKYDDIMKL